MRYLFVTGALTVVLAAGLAVIKPGDVFSQQTRVELRPVQITRPGETVTIPHVVGQQVQEAESDETTQLNHLDAQLGQQAESLVKQLADATDEKDRAKLTENLQETLTQQFDTQQKVRELEVVAIEARAKKLRDVINKRNDGRRSIIDKRLDQLLREAEGLGWNSPAGGAVVYGQPYGRQVGNNLWSNHAGYPAGRQPSPNPAATPRER